MSRVIFSTIDYLLLYFLFAVVIAPIWFISIKLPFLENPFYSLSATGQGKFVAKLIKVHIYLLYLSFLFVCFTIGYNIVLEKLNDFYRLSK